MRIQILNPSENPASDVIIPLAEQEALKSTLAAIATIAGVPEDLLVKDFSGKSNQIHTLYPQKKSGYRWYLLGTGKKTNTASISKAFRFLSNKKGEQLSEHITVDLHHSNIADDHKVMATGAAVNGLILGTYQIGLYKETKKQHPLTSKTAAISIICDNTDKQWVDAARRGHLLAETQLRIFDLVNAPGNKATPQHLAQWAVDSGKASGYATEVLDKAAIAARGLEALLAVNRGSEYPPAFIIMQYEPEGKGHSKLPVIGLVGKGVTFDTGGLSIKGATNMHYMKSDMGGAAAVLGAMEVVSRLQLPVRLIGIVPTTDNCVDANSVKPGDVIGSYSGKTIEVIDTDAEGRLILADGLSYMNRNFEPDVMIDLATLTGSSVRTFGYECGALMSNDDELASRLIAVGEACGERLWRLPLWDEYKDDISSDVADVRNFSGRPVAGAISAGKFLEVFTGEHPCWAHLDIAGVAFGNSEFSKQRSATAYGVQLLTNFIEDYSKKSAK